MTAATPENASHWRDLALELTPGQVAEIESCERELKPVPGLLLEIARSYAADNTLNAFHADVPAPADATSVGDWHDPEDTLVAFRHFDGTRHDAKVRISGIQYPDARVERCIRIYAADFELTSAQARDVARALVAAADELDRLA